MEPLGIIKFYDAFDYMNDNILFCFVFKTGYELHGVENLPEGPGLIIYYHAALPIDYIFFLARIFFLKNKLCCYTVVDHFVFKLPGDIYFICIIAFIDI